MQNQSLDLESRRLIQDRAVLLGGLFSGDLLFRCRSGLRAKGITHQPILTFIASCLQAPVNQNKKCQ